MTQPQMATLLAVALFPLLIAVQLTLGLLNRRRSPTGHLVALYLGIAAYLGGWLGFWNHLGDEMRWESITAGFSTAGFLILGYLQVHALLDRGITLQLLIDLYRRGIPMKRQELREGYSGNRGVQWLFAKRVRHMRLLQVVTLDGDRVTLRWPLGVLCARLGLGTKAFLRLGPGG